MTYDAADWVGRQIAGGRYFVESKLGEGGMGFVYKGRDNNLETDIVIKVPRRAMLDVAGFAERFAREVRSLVKLQHPHVVKLIDVGDHDGLPFAVMQCLTGGDLSTRFPIGADGERLAMPARDVVSWLPHVADALDFVHSQGYIHRDVKPANILFDSHGNVFLSDFGVARVVSENIDAGEKLTGTGMVLGTPEYMAPELIMGEPCDGRVDQYALAVMTHEVLCGRVPYVGATPAAVLVMQTTHIARPLCELYPSIPLAVSDAVMRGFAKNPADRFPDCRSFAQALAAAVAVQDFVVVPADPSPFPTAGFVSTASNVAPTQERKDARPRRRIGPGLARAALFALDAALLGLMLLTTGLLLLGVWLAAKGSLADMTELWEALESWRSWTILGTGTLAAGFVARAMALARRRPATPPAPSAPSKTGFARHGPRAVIAAAACATFVVLGLQIVVLNAIEIPAESGVAPPSERELVEAVPLAKHVAASDFVNPLGMKMVAVAPGRFLDAGGSARTIAKPYWIADREVTVAQYFLFLKQMQDQRGADYREHDPRAARGDFAGFSRIPIEVFKQNGSPVVGVTRENAEAFCDWLSRGDGRLAYRLPTRDEWICAYRGGTTTKFHWGDAFEVAAANGVGAQDRFEFLAPGGRFPGIGSSAHPWGLSDMAGNVWEIVAPEGSANGGVRGGAQACGGAWNESSPESFSAAGSSPLVGPSDNVGFRVVAESTDKAF